MVFNKSKVIKYRVPKKKLVELSEAPENTIQLPNGINFASALVNDITGKFHYISDEFSHSVYKLNLAGTLLFRMEGKFFIPRNLNLMKKNKLLVSEWASNQIHMFDTTTGNLIETIKLKNNLKLGSVHVKNDIIYAISLPDYLVHAFDSKLNILWKHSVKSKNTLITSLQADSKGSVWTCNNYIKGFRIVDPQGGLIDIRINSSASFIHSLSLNEESKRIAVTDPVEGKVIITDFQGNVQKQIFGLIRPKGVVLQANHVDIVTDKELMTFKV